ncbi:MAG TPA: hypothetical protein GXZ46_02935 [Actinomycetales bacterium]|uniref:hypothetical protein n=1 Tax=uncultured Corynebacterium sp. TaxID=159447 RepID=UPI00175E17ED|nr:hypothetical protein [uncultured Corynebacterium sp.]HHU44586.1 hypothetical protein [Actinomycetales bacterium]
MNNPLPTVVLPDGSVLHRSDEAPMGRGRLAIIHNGTYFHLTAMRDPAILAHQPTWFYLPELKPGDLDGFETVVLADRMHPGLVRAHAEEFRAVAEAGNTLVVLGINEVESWLPGLRHFDRPTNFWWWSVGEDPGIRPASGDHPAWKYLASKAVIWHHHGAYVTESPTTPLVRLEEKDGDGDWNEVGAILLEDRDSTPGRIIVTSLDPFFHHGSNFMPGSTRFLYGLLRWVDHRD